MFRPPIVRVVLVLAIVSGVYFSGVAVRQLLGSCVDIRNTSRQSVRNVSVKVENTGQTYAVPDLAPGAHQRVYVRPTEKSRVTVAMTDARNRQRDFTVFSGALPGDCAVSMVTIQPGQNTQSDEFHHPVCWRGWLDLM
jgi:hypothetical protein